MELKARHARSPNSFSPSSHTNGDARFHAPFSGLSVLGDPSGHERQRPEEGEQQKASGTMTTRK